MATMEQQRRSPTPSLPATTRLAVAFMCLLVLIAAAIYAAALFLWNVRSGGALLAGAIALLLFPPALLLLAPLALVGSYPAWVSRLVPQRVRDTMIALLDGSLDQRSRGPFPWPRLIAVLAVVIVLGIYIALSS